jgi:ribosomal-protein-alanine N-acetyltransferase
VWSPADGFPVLTTARTVLREIVATDAGALYAFRSDVEEQRYNDPPLTDVDEAAALVERLAREYRDDAVVRWGLTVGRDDVVVGLLGYNSWNREHARAEIGYDLSRRLWGRGLAGEAVRAVVDFGFDRMGLERIGVRTDAANLRSVRMLDRLGFHREGTLRGWFVEDGTRHDIALYSVLRPERP